MTIDERLARIEHATAGLAEERHKDREENRQWWRDTQRQIRELGVRIEEVDERLGRRIEQMAEESQTADKRLGERVDSLGERMDSLGERIDSLVSAIGRLLEQRK